MSDPAATPVATPVSRFRRVLDVVRKLIDYGKDLATTLQQRAASDLAAVTFPFDTRDIGLILARITRGLLLANALEARVVALAAPAGCASQARPSAGPTSTACRAGRQAHQGGRPSPCPSAHAGADRRRSMPPGLTRWSAAGRSARSSPTSVAISASSRPIRYGRN